MFTEEKIKDLHYSVSGKLNANDLQSAADEVLTEYGKKAKMPGFRPGHIPLSVLRQKFIASAWGEAIDKALNADLQKYLEEKKIRLAAQPKVDMEGYEMGKDVEYSLEFDILPTLPEIDLEKMTVTQNPEKKKRRKSVNVKKKTKNIKTVSTTSLVVKKRNKMRKSLK